MKRYRILRYDFDARAYWLGLTIADEWELQVKQMHWQNRLTIIDGRLRQRHLESSGRWWAVMSEAPSRLVKHEDEIDAAVLC